MKMQYRVTYDNASKMIVNVEAIYSSSVELELEDSFVDSMLTGQSRFFYWDGVIQEDKEPITVEENIVPSKEEAERLGLDPNVGVSADVLE